ncbi:hypothetical protein EAI_07403, partial [Harpegnathos saltator]
KIIFSDQAHFHVDGLVNRQDCRIWGSENPRVIVEKQMHPQRVTVWYGFWVEGIIGPFFFENAAGQAITGATCHTARETIQLLHGSFLGRVISRFGDQIRPPRSCNLTPLDLFLWGF